MKILIDYRIFFLQKYGGISRYFLELANGLNKTNNDVKIISPVYVNKFIDKYDKKVLSLKKINNIPLYTTKVLNFTNFFISNIYIKSFKPDIIHQTYFNNHFYSDKKAKKIINVWDLNHEIFHKSYNMKNDYFPKKDSLDNADHIICSSKKTQKDLINYYNISLEKTSVLYQGVPSFTNITKKFEDPNKPFILYVGSRKKYKNFDNFIKAISIKNILKDFDLICFGNEEFNDEEMNLFDQLKIDAKKIKLVSGDDGKLVELYSTASAMIYPSKNEGFGFPPLEAMSLSCPVIVSNNQAIDEAVGDAALKFDPNNIEDISSKINQILYSDELKKKFINLGKERVKMFSWEKTILDLLNIYKKLY